MTDQQTHESVNDLAPWPRSEAEATADSLAKALAVHAYARQARIHDMPKADDAYRAEIGILVNEYGVIRLLKFLGDFHPDVADDAARLLWADWEDGSGLGEWLWEWLTEWKIDPDQVAEVAAKARAERAAKASEREAASHG